MSHDEVLIGGVHLSYTTRISIMMIHAEVHSACCINFIQLGKILAKSWQDLSCND
jgi:hypothetical protein